MTQSRTTTLRHYLETWRHSRFEPGVFDCVLFVAGWDACLFDRDLAAPFRGKYRTVAQGRAMMRKAGFEDIEALISARYSKVVGWTQSQTGDVALVQGDRGHALGLIGGSHIHVLSPHVGLNVIPLDRALKVYRP